MKLFCASLYLFCGVWVDLTAEQKCSNSCWFLLSYLCIHSWGSGNYCRGCSAWTEDWNDKRTGGGKSYIKKENSLLFQAVISPYLQTECGHSCGSQTAQNASKWLLRSNPWETIDVKQQCAEVEKISRVLRSSALTRRKWKWRMCCHIHWSSLTKYKFEVLLLCSSISFSCNLILLLER